MLAWFQPSYHGLSSAEAQLYLKKHGPNARPVSKKTTMPQRLWGIFSEPMMLLLIATGVVYLFLGNIVDTIVIFISIIPIGIIEFIQQTRTDKAIALLDELLVEKCKVYRDGLLVTLESRWLVPGDVVFVAAGDKLPADGIVLESTGLQIDESILTGESVPAVRSRTSGTITDENKVFQGTLVVQGEGNIVIVATGANTAYGKLGSLLEKIETQKTPLQRKIEQLVRTVALGAVSIAVLIGIILTIRHGILPGLLGALTVAISIIPEEFPVVFSVFLIMGVWRLAKEKALVREMVMVETLGAATVICSDKTGTLTEGKMSLQKIYFDGQLHDVSSSSLTSIAADQAPLGLSVSVPKGGEQKKDGAIKQFIHDALLALEQIAVDPIETELQRFGKAIGVDPEALFKSYTLRKDGYFDAATKMVHHTWEQPGPHCYQYTAGAPELVIEHSTLKAADKASALQQYQTLAHAGYRVIGVAKTPCSDIGLFATKGFEFRGLLAMSDPPRAGVREAIALCQQAGIRIMMITGDNVFTARAIAKHIGLVVDGVIEGSKLEQATTKELERLVKEHTIFARVRPEQKYLIVEALQAQGEVVAMTGDGVNDAPALKKATIGIAMGQKGTAVARAAAGIVLLDDNFATIVNAIREGRRIYDNMRRAFCYLLTFHIPIIGLALVPIAFGHGLFFLPIHIIFLELFCDPAVVLGFERDKLRRGAMHEPPRQPTESLIPRELLRDIIIRGMAMFLVAFGFYMYYGFYQKQLALGRTLAFVALVFSELLLIVLTHEWHQVKSNRVLLTIVVGTLGVLVAIVVHPFLRELFHFTNLSWLQLGVVFSAATLTMVVVHNISKRKI